jgi:tetratricopeptide (TPR) repeat protein
MSEPDELTNAEATKREGHASSKSERIQRVVAPEPTEFARGTLIGRYVVVDKLGEGGMGIVYRAFDPELDRKLAIKVLQGKVGADQAWLLREAQALARLAHPNVVAVHDVGTLPGDHVFVAMELVDGMTMRQWLKTKQRTWREIVPVLLAAGEGLAAAHDVALVHRDFKPENVLVGNDGRVRVMDFGLARLEPGDHDVPFAASPDTGQSPLSANLTEAGHVVGTPAYMAPEIYEDSPADASTDQFAFGVALFEALYRQRPFDKADLQPSRSAPPKPRLPADARVPAHLERIALRAIAIDPKQRFGSMRELLSQLAIDPYARRRRALIAVGALSVVGAIGGGMVAMSSSHSRLCVGIESRLQGVWDASAKDKIHRAFAATKLPFAEQAYASLEQALDAYTASWVAAATESCKATRVRGDQTEAVLSLRQDCFDQLLVDLTSLGRVLAEPGPKLVEKGGKAASELDPVERCANVAALREPDKPPPQIAPQLRVIAGKLADAKAQMIAGNYIATGAAAAEVSRLARDLDYFPAIADAEFLRATTLMTSQSWDEAEKAFRGATWAAMQARRDDVLAHGALSIAEVDVQGRNKAGEAQVWLDLAKAALKRLGGNDPKLALRVLEIEGVIAATTGDLNAAIAAHRTALAEGKRYFGADSPLLWENEAIYAASLTKANEFREAAPHYERAIELRSRVVGPDHGDVALTLSNLGICYRHLRDPRARATFERAIALREKLYGKNSPILVPTLDNYGEFLRQEHEFPAALSDMERALRLAKVFPGVDHPDYHRVATDYAVTLTEAGRLAEARAMLDEVLAREVKTGSTTRAWTLTARAELELAQRTWREAEVDAQHAVDDYEAAGGVDNPELWRPLTDLARARVGLTRPVSETRPLLERALAIGTRIKLDDIELAATRDALANVESTR